MTVVLFLMSFAVILSGCELFVNSVEWFGRRFHLGEGAVGSVLAAVGTALPETIIPIIAIAAGGTAGVEVGTGAILGAPFMLSTLAMFVCGSAVVIFSLNGSRSRTIRLNRVVLNRDLSFFLVVYSVGVLVGVIHLGPIKHAVALLLLASYGVYVYRTMKSEGDLPGETRALYFHAAAESPMLRLILLQLFVALSAIILGADLFVHELTKLAEALAVSPLVISLLLTPIATELPEKFNSVMWMRQRKDTLALGNITGAMVFQSAIPVAVGVAFTPWQLDRHGLLAAGLALASGSLLWLRLRLTGRVGVGALLTGGLFYLTFVGLILFGVV
jgi:cation:H+ antiporter